MATDSTAGPSEDRSQEIQSTDQSWFFTENPTCSPSELPNDPSSLNCLDGQPDCGLDDILGSDDPLSDPVIWAFCNETDDDGTGNSQAGPSGYPGESSYSGIDGSQNGPESSVSGDHGMALSVFSVTRSQYNCTFCQRLREITHINGMNVKRLEIHGRLGTITHAVLNNYDFDSSFQSPDFQMLDFSRESTQTVKLFLFQYFEACKQEGYNMLQDPLSTFYEALCVGLNEPDNPDDFLQFSPENTGYCPNYGQEMLKQPENESINMGNMKIPLGAQRARTGRLKLKDLVEYIELPMEDAARKMNVCPTVLKKVCRKHGLLRWPYRKIKSIQRKISEKSEMLSKRDNVEKAQIMADIQKHQQELANIYETFNQ